MSELTEKPMALSASSSRLTDLTLAGLVVAVIVMMALPLPAWALDILVATSIAMGVVLLLVALFVPTPLAFSSFPAVLLITTLFRISLSVATTRQILLYAHAGDIITAFGRLVVGGSLIVGLVVFLIITVVQFIVIAKGAERVAEVGARFTLDALPGKQMSIDADVRAGLISQADAVEKRRELIEESQFFGAMDGAMKFVKGDAIAGIIIVLVNLLGGIAIGTLVMNMTVGAAIHKFAVLSIGDGLVTQIPALFVAMSAGIVITRSAPDKTSKNLGEQIGKQLGSQPRALLLAAGVMALFALVPGFPTITFLVIAAGIAAVSLLQTKRAAAQESALNAVEVRGAARDGEQAPMLLKAERPKASAPSTFRLEIADALAQRIGASGLSQALIDERRLLREHYGIPFPGVVLQTMPLLPPDHFSVMVQDLADASYALPEGGVLVVGSSQPQGAAQALAVPGPALLGPCHWVAAADATAAREAQMEVLSPAHVMARLLMRTIQKNAGAALGVQEVKLLVREVEGRFADLVREAQAVLPIARIADLMAALARERVPLTDFPGLLQALVTNGPGATDLNGLYESVRLAMARGIVARQLPAGGNRLSAVTLDADMEAALRAALVMRPDGPVLALPPPQAEAAAKALQAAVASAGLSLTVLLATDLRRAGSRLFRSTLPGVAFVSQDELSAAGVPFDSAAVATLPRQAA
jgi:type III secretion protein V